MKMKHTLLAAAALSLLSTTASAVDWGGYFRVGPGQKSTTGPDAKCFGANMEGGTYRLGNECNTYGEFMLSQGGQAGGVDYKAYLMTNFFKEGTDIGDTKVGINQIYAEGKGFDIAPNQTFWIGKRFYGRADVHIVDTFFVNMSGTGAGADGFDLGVGSLNVSVFRDGDNTTNPGTRLNLDLNGIKTNPGGTLRPVNAVPAESAERLMLKGADVVAYFTQGRYVQGQIAAKVSKTGTAVYIASFPIPEVVQGINSFEIGARSVNPDFDSVLKIKY